MPSRAIVDLHPDLQPLCRRFMEQCKAAGLDVILTCTYRNPQEQNAEYAKGRTKPGSIITNAKAGQSLHNFEINGQPAAKAFDIGLRDRHGFLEWDPKQPCWQRAGKIGKALGLIWGGDWHSIKDYPHFELPTHH